LAMESQLLHPYHCVFQAAETSGDQKREAKRMRSMSVP
jgi:hypothetical protein